MKLGLDEIISIYIGSEPVKEIAIGKEVIYDETPAPTPDPPTPDPCEEYSSQEECDCVTYGGDWDGEECIYPDFTLLDCIYEDNSERYEQEHYLNTGIEHTASTMTVEIEYYGCGGNSDRMVGYQEGDDLCVSDDNDFRVFGYEDGTFDYLNNRYSYGGRRTDSSLHHLIFGDCYCYDAIEDKFLIEFEPTETVPTPNCHILVDVSFIKVKSVKIKDGNDVLFYGVAAEQFGEYGLYDLVGHQLITNNMINITGDSNSIVE